MPVYEYACTECGTRLEVRQNFTDEPLTTCAVCGGRLRKLLSPVGVVFKGSGFYRTDSRSTPSEGASSKSGTGTGDAGGGESGAAAASKKGASQQKSGDGSGTTPRAGGRSSETGSSTSSASS